MAYGLRGLIELVRARLAFDRLEAREILARNAAVAGAAKTAPESVDPTLAARIGYILPRLADRLPWRSDCVIQAMAAQTWLAAHGLASEIQIGVERPDNAPFGAHAWLVHGGKVVTGGDIDRYTPLVGESPVGDTPATRPGQPLSQGSEA
jgi:hypothetical protein